MRLDWVRLNNFRCFADEKIDLAARFNLLIGDNGTGKTSVLHGVSIGIGSLFLGFPEPAEPSYLDEDVARHVDHGTPSTPSLEPQYPVLIVCFGLVNGETVAWERKLRLRGRTTRAFSGRLKEIAEEMAHDVMLNEPVILPVLGYYGTGRVWKQKKLTEVKTISPASRFMAYLNCLDPASDEKRLLEWFKTRELVALQQKKQLPDLEAVREALRICIPNVKQVSWDMAADQLMIHLQDSVIWFRQLSDGYRNMLAMVADIAERCVRLNPHLSAAAITETPGIVLIDEIDLHLHPKWQRHVVEDLLRTFPKVQFIATTHSPFIIQSLVPQEGVKLINLDNPEATDFVSKSIEDIVEEVQGIEMPQKPQRYQEMVKAAETYFAKLQDASTKNDAELEQLKQELDLLSAPYRDNPAYQAFLQMQRAAAGLNGSAKHAPR